MVPTQNNKDIRTLHNMLTNMTTYGVLLFLFLVSHAKTLEENLFCPAQCKCTTNTTNSHPMMDVQCRRQKLQFVPRSAAITFVESLDLSQNDIGILKSHYFTGFDNLRKLILKNAKIRHIEAGTFLPLKDLVTIDLSHNSLAFIHPDIFSKNTMLLEVYLHHNPLSMINGDQPILSTSSLTHLDISNSKISQVSLVTFSEVRNLEFLNLSNNRLQSLPLEVFKTLPYLTKVNLSGNEWKCGHDFEAVVCWAYHKQNNRRMVCSTKAGIKKTTYELSDQIALCQPASEQEDSVEDMATPSSISVHEISSQLPLDNTEEPTVVVSTETHPRRQIYSSTKSTWPAEDIATQFEEIKSAITGDVHRETSTSDVMRNENEKMEIPNPDSEETVIAAWVIPTAVVVIVVIVGLFLIAYFVAPKCHRIYQRVQEKDSSSMNEGYEGDEISTQAQISNIT